MYQSKAALIILDGFGITPELKGNAVLNAKTPNFDAILQSFPKTLLKASAEEVGLPWGEFGSSEVGHTTIGMGRIVLQNLLQINKSFEEKTFEKKAQFKEILGLIDQGSSVNLILVLSDGGIHGHMNHAIAIIELIRRERPKARIKLHLITDGRDTAEKFSLVYFERFIKKVGKNVEIASLIGRFYAMDRDKNWERTQEAYDAILGKGNRGQSVGQIIKSSYANKKTDEFIEPFVLSSSPTDFSKDVFIFTNFRADRAIQLTRAFVDPTIPNFNYQGICSNFFTMTTYDDNLNAKVLFSNIELNDPQTSPLTNPLVKVVSDNRKTQLHVAETEKYAHITYFFAGGIKENFPGQENRMVQSKRIPSYDVFPQMRTPEIAQTIINAALSNFDFIFANFANCDMVGHSGNYEASVNAVSIMDNYLGQVVGSLIKRGYVVFVTADHGNCDEMIDINSDKPNKEHTLNPVPFICCNSKLKGNYSSKEMFFNSTPIGLLADIAPTLLSACRLAKPPEMTGSNIIQSMS